MPRPFPGYLSSLLLYLPGSVPETSFLFSALYFNMSPEHGLHDFFFFLVVLGFEFRAYTLSHSTSPFSERFFQDRVSQSICPGLVLNLYPPDLCLLSS
jgi:hypothetical protein